MDLAIELKKYNYQDILDMKNEDRYEIISGYLYEMGSPSYKHQMVLLEIAFQFKQYLKNKKCQVIISPSDVKLDNKKNYSKTINVVQPDLYVVCDENKIDNTGIIGSPDLIIEVLSPSNITHDRLTKYNLYQKFGVKEYWIVDLKEKLIQKFILNDEGIYTLPKVYKITEKVKVHIFEDLIIDLEAFCEENKNLLKEDEEEYG